MKIFTPLIICCFLFFSFSSLQAQTKHIVEMKDNVFVPDSITIHTGDTVEWVDNGTTAHTTTSGTNCTSDGKWDSGNLQPGNHFTFTFSTAGNYPYFCTLHCSLGMVGFIKVEDSNSGIAQTSKKGIDGSPVSDVKLYPAPFKDMAYLEFNLSQSAKIELTVYDVLGNKIIRPVNEISNKGLNKINMNLSNEPAGIYFYELKVNDKLLFVRKMVKRNQ